MLNNFFISFKFSRFCQSGFYIDFFLKKWAEVAIRNVFVYAAQFVGEKFMIETLTKKIIDRAIFYINKRVGWYKLSHLSFFFQIVCFFFYFSAG